MPPVTTARQPFDRRHFLVVMVVEAVAIGIAAVRVLLSDGAIGFSAPPHLTWFLVTIGLATAGVATFSVRSSLLRQKEARGESTDDARKMVLATTLAVEVGAIALAAIGPAPFVALMGS